MVRASKGLKRGTRRKYKRGVRHKFTVEMQIKEFKLRDRVIIRVNPSSTNGFPPMKFQGTEGSVISRRGSAYVLSVKEGNKKKTLIVQPEHLKPAKGKI